MSSRSSVIFVGAACIGVVVAVGLGLAVIGSPANIRLERLDNTRSQSLQAIAFAMRNYRRSHGALPETLDKLQDDFSASTSNLRDPETGALYEYRTLNNSSYEICAQFSTVSDGTTRTFGNPMFWKHPGGRHCFTLDETTSMGDAGSIVKYGFINAPEVTNKQFK